MIIYDNMIYFMMANDISRERNNIFRSNEMISRERNNIHFFHRCPLRGSVKAIFRARTYNCNLFSPHAGSCGINWKQTISSSGSS